MLAREYLVLRRNSLMRAEEWLQHTQGFALVFPLERQCIYHCGRVVRQVQPGEVIFSKAGRGAKITNNDETDVSFVFLEFSMEHFLPLFADTEISAFNRAIETLPNFKIYPDEADIAQKCHAWISEAPATLDLVHRCHMLRLVAFFLNEELRACVPSDLVGACRSSDPEEQLKALSVDDLIDTPVDKLAARFGCSRRQLNRLFHRHLGYSIAALRMELRMQQAARLLRDRQAKIINVAERCGFNHLGLFNICFKKRFKMPPSQWRKLPLVDHKPKTAPKAVFAGETLRHGRSMANHVPIEDRFAERSELSLARSS
jgi:AraC-like DNA-binding protein